MKGSLLPGLDHGLRAGDKLWSKHTARAARAIRAKTQWRSVERNLEIPVPARPILPRSESRLRLPNEGNLDNAPYTLLNLNHLPYGKSLLVSLERSNNRARHRQEAHEWRRETADGTRYGVLVRRDALARVCRRSAAGSGRGGPRIFEQLHSYIQNNPLLTPARSSQALTKRKFWLF